ncbi:MAG: GxxExxY protein [Terrimicrobiaceae bacterium]|nr:GxxExxY protein [Terrimicrobiaceae bacterium]
MKGEIGNVELTGKILAAAIDVHRALGPGFLESIYEAARCVEFETVGLRFERQKELPIFYRGRLVGEHRLDLLVENRVVVELKAVKAIEPIHFAVVRSYIKVKALNLDDALLLNFGTAPLTVRRLGRELPAKQMP